MSQNPSLPQSLQSVQLSLTGYTIVWDGVFDPFGNLTSVSGSVTNLLMFPGQYYDSETQLSQNWFRDYDPSLGRYGESDPIGLDGGINTYGYAKESPAEFSDQLGLWPFLAPESGFDFAGMHIPSKATVIAQLQQSLQKGGICEKDSRRIAVDITNEIDWGDLANVKSLQAALASGQGLTPNQKKATQSFINRLPPADQPPLNKFLQSGAQK